MPTISIDALRAYHERHVARMTEAGREPFTLDEYAAEYCRLFCYQLTDEVAA